jgi:hypothetical protein
MKRNDPVIKETTAIAAITANAFSRGEAELIWVAMLPAIRANIGAMRSWGTAITPGQELASETITPTTRAVKRPIQMPWPTNGTKGPLKISAAKDPHAIIVNAAVTIAAAAAVIFAPMLSLWLVLSMGCARFYSPILIVSNDNASFTKM